MTQAEAIAARIPRHRFPATCGSTTRPAGSERQEAAPSAPCAQASDFEQALAAMTIRITIRASALAASNDWRTTIFLRKPSSLTGAGSGAP